MFDIAVPTRTGSGTDDETMLLVWSYGMGAESTAALVRTILDPTFRHPCLLPDLSNLIVVTAQTGDEFTSLAELVERYVLPLFRAHNIRTVEVARAGPRNEDGIVVLQDTRQPERMHFDAKKHGFYALSDENRANAVQPQRSGKRKCTLKFKGWPMDTWRDRELGTRPYLHAIGYNAEEENRIARESVLDLGGHRQMVYPIHDVRWTRQHCREYLYELFGVWWPKSLCRECCFVSKLEWPDQLARLQAEPSESYRHVVDEYVTLALNAKSGLFGPEDTLTERLRAAGAHAILELAENEIFHSPWALYRLRRVYFAPATARRSVDVALRGTREHTQQMLQRLAGSLGIPTVTDARHHTRLWLAQRPPQSTTYPQVECFYVAIPALVADKQPPRFENHWAAHASDQLRELDMTAADHLHRCGPPAANPARTPPVAARA
ncbi:hypothetical protein IU450_36195 [Nocardia abscessus]|uniref:hypothetical protein n=1 Tax=Nocardia abscessus TaxID=120957 RepID=UPI0018960EF6|nr:hypothetical protein [Nocardia abscessus]MBF6341284.1 hypothetical protein [Nocardia abscessus]